MSKDKVNVEFINPIGDKLKLEDISEELILLLDALRSVLRFSNLSHDEIIE